ncbi:hypothetical protein A2210_02020 [Candidatus Woesebacteria bacterium RIFOXYA1_FULL_40_18]|uniref:Cell division protein FtsL n=5 Tax=Candidatus Woeseibacteriota TaxID=1752722 RepID=A0A0G0SEF5_9BACT|nr:MAG: hypothetical protein UT72_C0021G0003 [Candidatus Woesebacteria bacterium GW2011_GWB1_40_101]KKR63219.1 MAG: hypothetical protein UU03_C0009G0005 [Candidatus Woesebacteria bacterium GW2011_GWA1_40_45]OGM76301.1 MAG: hypothetical protein A2210_02020 [Candidatus Woesebacteria bacterium RIFOXYA1_FULL_40_18]OGM81424.1 MAG: hypothetical protein A2361_01830 [Candidatus Woesebacteria bacterium RIFOXYB1_FULL_40_26]OGM87618.1 MAG: hypothetical protein A2614_01490 [Candidatus Woesebacteria bacteri
MDIRKIILIILVFALISGAVLMTVEMSTLGADAERTSNEEVKLKEENRQLKSMLVEGSSLSGLEKNAEGLGYLKPDYTLYISGKEAYAAKLP